MIAVAGGLIAGCSLPTHVLPADDAAASKVKSELDADRSFIVNERFVVLPVAWHEDSKGQGVFYLGSMAIKASAWQSGLASGSSFPGVGSSALNFTVVDLESGKKQRVFDHHVATWIHPSSYAQDDDAHLCRRCGGSMMQGDWFSGMRRQNTAVLRYPGLLILIARTQDTHVDRQIDGRDAAWLFVYDVPNGKLKRVSPEGYRVEYMSLLNDLILVFMAPQSAPLDDTSTLAIYRYDPKTDKGELIKDIQ